jgi:hypothetical protein
MLPISAALGFRDGFLYRLWKRSAGSIEAIESGKDRETKKAEKSFF